MSRRRIKVSPQSAHAPTLSTLGQSLVSRVRGVIHPRCMDESQVELLFSGRGSATRPDRDPSLHRVRSGIYTTKDAWEALATWQRYVVRLRAFRAQFPRAILSHGSAAVALGLPLIVTPTAIHTYLDDADRSCASTDIRKHASIDERSVVQTPLGPATCLADTAVDLGRTIHRGLALAVWDAALRRGAPRDVIADLWRRQRSRRSLVSLRWLEETADPRSESPGESVSRALFEWLGFDRPEIQRSFRHSLGEYRTDFFWKRGQVVGEFDGKAKYTMSSPDPMLALRQEKIRETYLRRLGLTVVRWEFSELTDPERLRARLLEAGVASVAPSDLATLASFRRALREGC